MADKKYKLIPELVPQPLWGRNVHHALGRRKPWHDIRGKIIKEANSSCSICGERREKGMYCHEVWSYDDNTHVATLINFKLLCPLCNQAQHFGMTTKLGKEAVLNTIRHIMKINNTTEKETINLIMKSREKWLERSKHKWEIHISENLLQNFPVLKDIEL